MFEVRLAEPSQRAGFEIRPTRAPNLVTLALRPLGRYAIGATWMNLCARRELWVHVIWGRPTQRDIDDFTESLRAESGGPGKHASLFDCSAIEDVRLDDVRRIARLLETRDWAIGHHLCRNAVVCTADLASFLLEARDGEHGSRTQMFVDFGRALDWVCPTLSAALRNEIGSLRSELTSGRCLITKLRRVLRDEPSAKLDVGSAARQLGCSRRSLQRALMQRGTSFRTELTLMRLERAKRELSAGASVTSLAFDLGFQNVQAFIRLFKQGTGVTPGVWRKRDPRESTGAEE